MTSAGDLDPLALAGAKAKGKRPYFFKDPDIERVLAITMAVAGELSVLRARIDTIENLLDERGTISRQDIDNFAPDAAQEARRSRWNQEYIARILRIVQQEREALESKEEPTSEKVGDELAKP